MTLHQFEIRMYIYLFKIGLIIDLVIQFIALVHFGPLLFFDSKGLNLELKSFKKVQLVFLLFFIQFNPLF